MGRSGHLLSIGNDIHKEFQKVLKAVNCGDTKYMHMCMWTFAKFIPLCGRRLTSVPLCLNFVCIVLCIH